MRLAANTGCALHLIEPLGFEMDDVRLRRAGMDYRDRAVVTVHPDVSSWRDQIEPSRIYAVAKSGPTRYSDVRFVGGEALIFGRESVGLPRSILDAGWVDDVLSIPMQPGVRSLNLSNSVAIVVYEAWRQLGFSGSS